jgi:hypothetical protein
LLESPKPLPVIWTEVPIGPLVGLNEEIVGAAANAVSAAGTVNTNRSDEQDR